MAARLLDPVLEALSGPAIPGIDPRRLADMLQMSLSDLADIVGIHRTTLTRNPGSAEVQARLGPVATILTRASGMGAGRIVDLDTPGALALAGLTQADLAMRWFGRSDTPTQQAARHLLQTGIDGLIYRLLQHAPGRNLVLWAWDGVTLVDRLGEAMTTPLA